MAPLPDLGPRDLRSCGILHQVVNWHASRGSKPGLEIADTYVDVEAKAVVSNLAAWNLEQIRCGDTHVVPFSGNLVRCPHMLIENFLCDGNQTRMRHPSAVVAGAHFAQLVVAHLFKCARVCFGIGPDRDLRGHATHGVDAAAMASADEKVDVGLEKMLFHRHRGAIGNDEFLRIAKGLDEAEDVIPAPAVEASRMFAEFVEDFIHFECSEDCFYQYGGADGTARNADVLLSEDEHVVPEAGLKVTLHLGQIEVGAAPLGKQHF